MLDYDVVLFSIVAVCSFKTIIITIVVVVVIIIIVIVICFDNIIIRCLSYLMLFSLFLFYYVHVV